MFFLALKTSIYKNMSSASEYIFVSFGVNKNHHTNKGLLFIVLTEQISLALYSTKSNIYRKIKYPLKIHYCLIYLS